MFELLYGIENISFFDSFWVGIHFGSGVLVGIALIIYFNWRKIIITAKKYSGWGISILVLWEYFEVFLRYADRYNWSARRFFESFLPDSLSAIESLTNIMSDLIIGGFGLFLIYQFYLRGSTVKSRKS